jgi:predicted Zn-dependent protease
MQRIILLFVFATAFWVADVDAAKGGHRLGPAWRSAQNLTVYDCTTTPALADGIARAVAGWNKAPEVEMSIVRTSNCNPIQGAIVVKENALCGGWSASISTQGKQIKSVYVGLSTVHCGGPALPDEDLQLVACHELGHAIGLDHQPYGETSCMVGFDGTHLPNAHDYEQLAALY